LHSPAPGTSERIGRGFEREGSSIGLVISTLRIVSAPGSRAEVVRSTHLTHLVTALELTNVEERNLVVMTVRIFRGPDTGYERRSAGRGPSVEA
jgi:ribosomal protein L15E